MIQTLFRPATCLLAASLILGLGTSASLASPDRPEAAVNAFVQKAVAQGQSESEVRSWLDQAEYKQSIIDAITRPAEGKPWHQYRPIFITDDRIEAGLEFWAEHEAIINQAAETSGVDPAFIVAIIGVETFYGRITGNYRVLDALYTLGFHYPRRAEFFSGELLEFFQLSQEENLPLDSVTGSYAGAMGLGQFIPSSYRAYAVDQDGDGQRNLWASTADAVGSVANYFKVHGWHPDRPVALVANVANDSPALSLATKKLQTTSTLGELQAAGVQFETDLHVDTPASLVPYQQPGFTEYWVALPNFYVITRYNRSRLYALAVTQLAAALERGRKAG